MEICDIIRLVSHKKERNMETEQTLKSNVLESDVKNYLSTLRKQKEVHMEEVNQFFDLYIHLVYIFYYIAYIHFFVLYH